MSANPNASGQDRPFATGDVEVDLREALSAGTVPREPAGATDSARESPTAAGASREPAGDGAPQPTPPHDATGPSAPSEPRSGLGLLPEDIYEIDEGREVDDGLGHRVMQRLHRMLTSPPAKTEEGLDRDLQTLRARGLARGVTVALGSIKGGVGKTTLTLSLADMLAESLRCGVVVVDADLEWGTAADSTPQQARHGGTLTDVLAARDRIQSPGDLAPFLTSLPRGAQLLAGPTDPAEIEALRPEDMQSLLELLRRFFPLILLDLSPGIGLRGTIPRWAFESADQIVAIATPTRGSLRRAERMLAYLGEHHDRRPVTLALNMVPPSPDAASRRLIEVATTRLAGDGFAQIPRDDALTRQLDAGLLNIDELGQPTRIALKRLAHDLAASWCR